MHIDHIHFTDVEAEIVKGINFNWSLIIWESILLICKSYKLWMIWDIRSKDFRILTLNWNELMRDLNFFVCWGHYRRMLWWLRRVSGRLVVINLSILLLRLKSLTVDAILICFSSNYWFLNRNKSTLKNWCEFYDELFIRIQLSSKIAGSLL